MTIRAQRNDLDDFEPAAGPADRTFLGGLGLGARAWLYFFVCVSAGAALTALYLYVDEQLEAALQGMQRAAVIDELTNTVERGTYRLQARQRQFLLNRDTDIADAFSADLAEVSAALDKLFTYPEAEALAQHVTTVRDGLVQYDQQFQAFIDAELEIGGGNESGLSAQLRRSSAALRAAFRETGNVNLINQVERIDQQGEETVLSGSKKGVEEIRNRYKALAEFVQNAAMNDAARQRIGDLLKDHETQMLSIINARFALATQANRFEELVDYFVPSLNGLAGFADRLRVQSAAEVRSAQLFGRYTMLGGAAAILMWLLFLGLVLIKSLSGPAARIAGALDKIAAGASHVVIPAQGNKDAFGRIARIADAWTDSVIEAAQLADDLNRTKEQLRRALDDIDAARADAAAAERRADAAQATSAGRAEPKALPAPDDQPAHEPAHEPARQRPQRPSALEAYRAASSGEQTGGPISSVSQRLQNFSEYVTAAANDVERTEALIKGVDQMQVLVDDIADLVVTIRDQTNLLAFRSPGREALRQPPSADGGDNLIPFGGDERGQDAERAYTQRFDYLRDATDKTERTVMRIRDTLDGVSAIARDIARTASHQALDATNRLLSQSEYLQSMLDDIMTKIEPAKPGALSERKPPRRSIDDPFA